jgi:hypothetical protein
MSKSPVFRYVKENIETAAREANGFSNTLAEVALRRDRFRADAAG